jgi:hypothetical protein
MHALSHARIYLSCLLNDGPIIRNCPAFEDTWIECLGDLVRYRMAIEDDYTRDGEVWTGVARQWYLKASDNAPTTGRLITTRQFSQGLMPFNSSPTIQNHSVLRFRSILLGSLF